MGQVAKYFSFFTFISSPLWLIGLSLAFCVSVIYEAIFLGSEGILSIHDLQVFSQLLSELGDSMKMGQVVKYFGNFSTFMSSPSWLI